MRKHALILAGLLALVLSAPVVHAGVLIDLTTGTTSAPSGASDFYVASVSGTLSPISKNPQDLGLSEDGTETTIPLIDMMDPGRTYSIMLDEVTWAAGDGNNAANSGATFTVRIQYSNDNASWTLSGTSTVIDGVAVSGNSRYLVDFTMPPCRYMRVQIVSGITRFFQATAKLLIP